MPPRKHDFNFKDHADDLDFSSLAKFLGKYAGTPKEDTEAEKECTKPIHLAAEAKDLSRLRCLLDRGVSPDERSCYTFTSDHVLMDDPEDLMESEYVTPLMVAASVDFDAGVQELLALGANIECKDSEGRTALWYASAFHARETLACLISAGADVNVADLDGNTPLGLAVFCPGPPHILADLLAAGASPNLANKERCTPLHFAAANGTVAQVKMLLDAGANPHIKDRDGWIPLWHCTSNANPFPIIDLLRPFGGYWTASDLNRSSRRNLPPPLFANACMQCANPLFIRQLIKDGADVNAVFPTGATPLTLALTTCNQPAYTTLLECGADPNRPNLLGMTPLMIALSEESETAARVLLANGANVNDVDSLGQSALDYAFGECFDMKFLTFLLDQGADVNALDHRNCTPLMHAVRNTNETAIIELLLSRGANPNAISKDGETALHFAAENADTHFLRALLDAGADPCLIDPDCGVSALDEAVLSSSHTCVRYLLDALPNSPAAADILRESLDIARQENNSRAAKLIENKLATME